METRSRGNRCVGEAKVFEIAAIVSVAVRTMCTNRWRGWKRICFEFGVQPQLPAGLYRIRIAQRRRPCVGVFLREDARLQHLPRITGKKIESDNSETADDSVGMV